MPSGKADPNLAVNLFPCPAVSTLRLELRACILLEGILVALEALWANKLRTILTLLGNIVGVMSVIAVVSIIDGMNSYIQNEVADEGSGVFSVQQVNGLDILSDFDKFLKSLHNPENHARGPGITSANA